MGEQGNTGNAIRGGRRIWVPLLVVGALLALAAAEFAVNRALPARERLEAGTVVEFGAERFAAVEVGEGWSVDKANTKLDLQLVLVHGDTTVTLDAVQFPRRGGAAVEEMWDGMRLLLDTARYAGADIAIGEPSAFTTPNVTEGLTADLRAGDRVGTAFVLASEGRGHAVDGQVLAPADAPESESAAAAALIETIAFTEEDA